MSLSLVINTGSTSKKYALFKNEECVFGMRFEKRGDKLDARIQCDGEEIVEDITRYDFDATLDRFIETAEARKVFDGLMDITHVGLRVVAPGSFFQEHCVIDDTYLEQLNRVEKYAMLHIEPLKSEIEAVRRVLPGKELLGVSDSAFHATIPEEYRTYSFNKKDTEDLDLYRFGYHGLSVGSIVSKIGERNDGEVPENMIVVHIGGGASVTGVKNGKSFDTSMGFTPVGGLHMNTRTGDIDPGALLYLAERRGMDFDEVRIYINKEGGLKGITNGTTDMRDILDAYENDDEDAVRAVKMFFSRLQRYIGGYIALLGGLDMLVLTATANERNPQVRKMVCEGLAHLGISLDSTKNNQQSDREVDALLNKDGTDVAISLIHTDEMREIQRQLSLR